MAMTQQQRDEKAERKQKSRPASDLITHAELAEVLGYDPETGIATWLKSRNGHKAGERAGNTNTNGYLEVHVGGKRYLLHRLAFLLMTGSHPTLEIDHIDGRRTNNAWVNLREVSGALNSRNMKLNKTNKSGASGVHQCPRTFDWIATIEVNGRTIKLGRFNLRYFAKKARKEAEAKYGYHPNHGRSDPGDEIISPVMQA